jgi:hypothetical protein
MSIMNLDQFRSAFQTGGLRSVGVTASGGLFFVTGQPRSGELVTLATTRGKLARGFRDPGKAIAILHEIGARKVEVDTSEWSPAQAILEGRHRPDTAERQKRAHEAAGHDAWFRAEVEQALKEADDPAAEWLSNEQVKQKSAERRAKWRAG